MTHSNIGRHLLFNNSFSNDSLTTENERKATFLRQLFSLTYLLFYFCFYQQKGFYHYNISCLNDSFNLVGTSNMVPRKKYQWLIRTSSQRESSNPKTPCKNLARQYIPILPGSASKFSLIWVHLVNYDTLGWILPLPFWMVCVGVWRVLTRSVVERKCISWELSNLSALWRWPNCSRGTRLMPEWQFANCNKLWNQGPQRGSTSGKRCRVVWSPVPQHPPLTLTKLTILIWIALGNDKPFSIHFKTCRLLPSFEWHPPQRHYIKQSYASKATREAP